MVKIVVLIGKPSAGKSYVGDILQARYNYFHFDGDWEIPTEMRQALYDKKVISSAMRDEFFSRLITRSRELKKQYTKLAVSQTFIKDKYRLAFLRAFPKTQFLLIQTNDEVRERRLRNRKNGFPLDIPYSRKMVKNFDKVTVSHLVINNDTEGKDRVIEQLNSLFKK